ncbi:MAG: FHA domain-containing protein [Fimbriimonadales bacterium]
MDYNEYVDPNATQSLSVDPNRTQMTAGPSLNVTQTIQPVQCPVCKTFNPAGEGFCIECGLIFESALPEDAFAAPAVRRPGLVDENGREHFLRPGANIVGREGDILIVDSRVSRKHAQVTLDGAEVTVKDLGSTNGTTVAGQLLEPEQSATLEAGGKVQFGGVELTLSVPGEAQGTQVGVSRETQTLDTPPVVEQPRAFLRVGEERHPLKIGDNTLGRRPGNDVVLTDPYASGSHGKIEVEEGIYFTDLGSTNGTFLNGAKMGANERVQISSNDEIVIGQITLRIEDA